MPKIIGFKSYRGYTYLQPEHVVAVVELGNQGCNVYTVDGTKWEIDEPAEHVASELNSRLMTR